MVNAIYYILLGINVIVAIWLVFVVAIQTTKSEGLTGLSGSSPMSTKAKPGFEDHISKMTLYSAAAFMICTSVLAIYQNAFIK